MPKVPWRVGRVVNNGGSPGLDGSPIWFVTRYDDAVAVLLDDERFVREAKAVYDRADRDDSSQVRQLQPVEALHQAVVRDHHARF